MSTTPVSGLRTACCLVAVVALAPLSIAGCKNIQRQKAANAYKKELRAHRARFATFQQKYPSIETRLGTARRKAPKTVVTIIEQEMLPLLDSLVKGYDPMIKKGKAYVALLPESVDVKPKLKQQLALFRRQQEMIAEIHKTYVDEARLFTKGIPSRDDLMEVLNRRIAAARKMQSTATLGSKTGK